MSKVEKAMMNKSWDEHCFKTMHEALENLKIIDKLDDNVADTGKNIMNTTNIVGKVDAYTDTTEFEQLIYDIDKKYKGNYESMVKVTEIIADHMEDMRILNNRAYNIVMMKLREML